MKIAVIVGSIRNGRVGSAIGQWVGASASEIGTAQYDIVEVNDLNLSLDRAETTPMAVKGHYADPAVSAWAEQVKSYDGFIFVSAEYNSSIPAAFKNAFDSLGVEWAGKPIAFVGYGYGSGIKAVQAWKPVVETPGAVVIEPSVGVSLAKQVSEGKVTAPASTLSELVENLEAAQKA